LFLACEQGYTDIARILLEHHADPHRCNKMGHSPFTVAQLKGFKEILDIIEQQYFAWNTIDYYTIDDFLWGEYHVRT
jgi:ankyrin repeat protein